MHSTIRTPRRFAAVRVLVAVALFAAAGCGGRGVGTVSGRVMFKGKPVASGSVTMAAEEGPPVSGAINEDGTYVCRNVPAGPVKVGVVSPNDTLEARERAAQKPGIKEMADTPKFDPSKWFPIPAKYGNYANSPLKFEVKKGENTFDIDLEP